MTAPTTHREPPWKAGLRGARANLLPGLALQVVALTVVLAYYHHEPTRVAFEQLAALRARIGLMSGVVSTGFFGGLLPFLYLRYMSGSNCQYGWRQGFWLTVFWGYKGLEVELCTGSLHGLSAPGMTSRLS